jgi:hypothetical protein
VKLRFRKSRKIRVACEISTDGRVQFASPFFFLKKHLPFLSHLVKK